MGDDEAPHVAPAAVPTPRTPEDGFAGVPGTRWQWVIALGQVSGLLLALRKAELEDDADLPVPLAGGVTMRAWTAATQPVLRDPDHVPVPAPGALQVVGLAAEVLGALVCRARAGGLADPVVAVLEREAGVHDRGPEWLVAQIARVHGVLSSADPVTARVVWHALDDAEPDPAGP